MKQILSKIRALFRINGKEQEMILTSAEIKPGMIFLHSEDDPDHTFCVKTNDEVDIVINPHGSLNEDDILIIDNVKDKEGNSSATVSPKEEINKRQKEKNEEFISPRPKTEERLAKKPSVSAKTAKESRKPAPEPELHPNGVADWPGYRKRKISFSLYEDEYELLLEHLQKYGYKRAEFFYACIHAAKKKSMDAVYKQIEEEHKKRRAEGRAHAQAIIAN